MRILLILIFSFCLITAARADRVTSAYKQIQKGDFEKAKSLLDKELEKDSTSAGAMHIYAIYFFSENNPAYQLDSAYFSVLQAIDYYPQTEEKDSANWADEGVSIESALKLKANIEAKAYANAREANTVPAFQYFIDYFPTASEIPSAILNRDELAWEIAQQTNTLASYQDFIDSFPKAIQRKEATQKRDRFVYEAETQSGRLSAYEDFAKRFPDNYYRSEALERMFELISIRHEISTYQNFVQKYPNGGKATEEAWDWLLALYEEKYGLEAFAQAFPLYYRPDYLKKRLQVDDLQFIPFYENESFGFLDENGQQRIPAQFEFVHPEYLCESITDPYIIINKNGRLGLTDRLDNVIVAPQYDKINPIATGLFQVTKNAFQGLIQEDGRTLLPMEYDAIEVVNKYFLRVRKNRRWGLVNYNGFSILEPIYAEIEPSGDEFIIIRSERGFAVETNSSLYRMLTEKNHEIQIRFDEVELFQERYALVRQGEYYGLIDENFRTLFDITQKEIRYLPKVGWAAYKDSTWQVFDLEGQSIADLLFEKVSASPYLIGGKINGAWGAINLQGQEVYPFEYDSLAMVAGVMFLYQGKKVKGVFSAGAEPVVVDFSYFKDMRAEKGNYPEAETFLYYEDRYGRKGLFAQDGDKILSPKYSNVYMLDSDLVNVEQYNKYGLVDSASILVLPIRYQGITNMEKNTDYKILLLNNRFGLYSKVNGVKIEPAFDERPEFFGEVKDSANLFLAKKRGDFGLINEKNKTLIPFDYQAIEYWKTGTALVQDQDGQWSFYDYIPQAEAEEAEEAEMPEDSTATPAIFEKVQMIYQSSERSLAVVQREGVFGLWDSQQGELVEPQFELIENKGLAENPIFMAEKRFPDRQFEVSYINAQGKIIWQRQLQDLDYYKLLCE